MARCFGGEATGYKYCTRTVLLFIWPYKVVLSFESVDEMFKCDHSNESY